MSNVQMFSAKIIIFYKKKFIINKNNDIYIFVFEENLKN